MFQAWAVTSSSVLPFPGHESPPPVFHGFRHEFEIQADDPRSSEYSGGKKYSSNAVRTSEQSFEPESELGDDAELFLDDSGGFSFHSG